MHLGKAVSRAHSNQGSYTKVGWNQAPWIWDQMNLDKSLTLPAFPTGEMTNTAYLAEVLCGILN